MRSNGMMGCADVHAPSDHAGRYAGRGYSSTSYSGDYVHTGGDREGKGSVGALSGWHEYVYFSLTLSVSRSLFVVPPAFVFGLGWSELYMSLVNARGNVTRRPPEEKEAMERLVSGT